MQTIKKQKKSIPSLLQVVRRAKEVELDFLDYESSIWLFCPVGKVFDFGDAKSHYAQYEYGTRRSTFMWKAISKAHPHVLPEFYPRLKTEAYGDGLQLMEKELARCEEHGCSFCYFRQQLPLGPDRVACLAQFCLQAEYGFYA